jgi:putative membrane protein
VDIAVTGAYFYTADRRGPKPGRRYAVAVLAAGSTPSDLLAHASADPVPILVILGLGAWYWRAAAAQTNGGRPWPAWRRASFIYGLATLVVSLQSGLGGMGGSDFTAGAVRIALTAVVAPVLLVLGRPVSLALGRPGGRLRQAVSALVAWPGWRIAGHPVTVWALFGGSLAGLYATGLYSDVAGGGLASLGVQLELLATGYLWVWTLVGDAPLALSRPGYARRLLQIGLGVPFWTILGMALESTNSSSLLPSSNPGSIQLGGAILWVIGEGLIILALIAVWVEWLRADERRVKEADRANEAAAARQLALWRATREAAAAAAGSGPPSPDRPPPGVRP